MRTNADRLITQVLTGVITDATLPAEPLRPDAQGRAYLPVGSRGIVYGLPVDAPVFGRVGDHWMPGAAVAAPGDRETTNALVTWTCLGNRAWSVVAGKKVEGWVTGFRGEDPLVGVWFAPDVLSELTPGDRVTVLAHGAGLELLDYPDIRCWRMDPTLLLKVVHPEGRRLVVRVRAMVPSYLMGNGVGRPAASWEVDLQSDDWTELDRLGLNTLRLGDLVAIDAWEAVTFHGYAPGMRTVAVVVHGDSPAPGHGPGLAPILSGPTTVLDVVMEAANANLWEGVVR